MKTLNSITSSHWQPALNNEGMVVEGLNDLDQSIKTILRTPLGSDPHRPTFGSKIADYIDWPVNQARPYIVRESVEAIQRWEPRISIVNIMIEHRSEQLVIRVKWKAADGIAQITEVWYE